MQESTLHKLTDEEIQQWLARKFLLTLNNQKKFNQMEHDEGLMIEKHSHLNWNPIDSRSRKEMVNEVQVANVSTQDKKYFHVWELTQETQDIFDIVQ